MPIARKAAVSLLICVLLFAGFCFISFTSLFDKIETQFYDRAIINRLTNELEADAAFIDIYMNELQQRFSDILNERAIKSSFWVNQNSEDIYERSRIFASLGISLPGLQWVRFIDSTGNRIHYSTNPDDQILTDTGTLLYKTYPEVMGYVPFDQQMLSGMNMRRVVFDAENERLIFYYPFYDSMDIHRGEALFSVSINAFSERLIENARATVRDDIFVISNPKGIVIGIPQLDAASAKEAIASIWATGSLALSRVYAPRSGADSMTLLSVKTNNDIFVGRVVPENLFALPIALKALMIGAVFVTMFVLMFLILNVKQDAVAIVQSRLKELQVSLMNEYYQLMGDMDWAVWRRELEQRREDVKEELCHGVKIKKGSDIESYIDSFFNKSWDALLSAIGSKTGMITTFDETKLEEILSRVLNSQGHSGTGAGEVEELEDISGAEEVLEDLDDVGVFESGKTAAAGNERFDEIEELEEAESADDPAGEPADHPAEEPEELEEVDDPAEKLEELDGSVEPEERLEELEELEDPEDKPEELEELEELEDLEEPENSYAYETVAGGPYDVEEFEAVDEFGKGPYDVEEFEEVDPDPAPMSAKFAPSDLDDIDVENYQLNIDEMFEDFSDSPRPEFDSDNLRVYDPMSIYNAKTTDSLNSPSPNSPKPAAASARTQKKYKRAAKADGSHNEPKSSPELAAHDEQAQGKDEDAQESDDEDDDHKPQKTAARSEQSQKKDEGIPELDGEDDEPKPQKTAVQSEQSQEKNENIPESEGGNDETKVQKTAAPKTEDAAWLKLAGETAVMEPEDIWEELSEDIGEDAAKSAERPASLFSSEILEEDPYGSDAFKTTETDNTDYALENAEIVYGEFISLPAKTDDKSAPTAIAPKPALSADPLYNVEEFFEAEENAVITAPPPAAPYAANTSVVDNYTFELPGKGTDINEIAKKIEASEVSPEAHQEEANIKIDIASPFNELFSNDDTQEEPEAVRKPAAVRTKPETARKPAVIRIKPEAARKTAVVSNKPEIPQRYAAKLVKPETLQKPAAAKTKIETPRKPAAAVKAKPEAPRKPAVRAANAAAYPYQPFFQNSDELEYLESAGQEEEKSLIKKSRSGIDYINPTALKNAGVNVDPAMKNLVDSVLRH